MADTFRIESEGIDKVIKLLNPEQVKKGLSAGMQTVVLGVRRVFTRNLSGGILKRHQGGLVRGIFTRVENKSQEVVGIIGNTARWKYKGRSGSLLRVHEEGATIKPRKPGGFLVFTIGGVKVFTRKVVIPARRPLEKSVKARLKFVVNNLRTALLRQLRGN